MFEDFTPSPATSAHNNTNRVHLQPRAIGATSSPGEVDSVVGGPSRPERLQRVSSMDHGLESTKKVSAMTAGVRAQPGSPQMASRRWMGSPEVSGGCVRAQWFAVPCRRTLPPTLSPRPLEPERTRHAWFGVRH
jgi:hypothetical protein